MARTLLPPGVKTTLLTSLAALSAALIGTSATAQLATYRIVGKSCSTGRLTNSLGPVPLAVKGTPALGKRFSLVTEGAARYPWGNWSRATLITGLSNKSAGGVPLPLDVSKLAPRQSFCGMLRTSLEIMQRIPLVRDYRTRVTLNFDVPNQTALLGFKFYQQVMVQEFSTFGGNRRSMALSAGGEGTVGR